jgi:anaerobic nitric oxide reductase transcription regulator
VRIIAATNRDLKEEAEDGRFRADLYHRLSVYPIRVPKLQERDGDVQILSGYFVEQTKRKLGVVQLKITSDAIRHLEQYNWPGNVRELEHVVSRAALKARARQKDKAIIAIEKQDCGSLINLQATQSDQLIIEPKVVEDILTHSRCVNLRTETEQFQRQLIKQVLTQEQGNWAATARRLSIDRANLNRIAKRLDIKVVKSIVMSIN